MTPENRTRYAEELMARARESIETAEKNLRIEEYKVTTSQSYYAMFYAVSALLAARNIFRAKHFGVISAFGEHLAKAGDMDPVLGRTLSRAYDSRIDCDYNPRFHQTREGAEDMLRQAREFLAAAEERLKIELRSSPKTSEMKRAGERNPEPMKRALDDLGLKPNERAALEELRDALKERLGERLVKFVLFGSKARGESDEESDVDVLLVIRDFDKERDWDEWNVLEDLAFEIGDMRHGVMFNTIEYSQSEYEYERRREIPLITNIEREGIPL